MKISRILKHFAYLTTAFAMLTAIATAQEFTIHMKTDTGAEATTYYVTPTAMRRASPGLNDVIYRFDRGTLIYLDHRNKTYKEGPVAPAREAIAKGMANMDPQKMAMMHQMGLDAPPQLTKIGPGESIAGYPTDKYSLKTGMAEGELWITQSLQFPAAYYRDFNLLEGVGGPFGAGGKILDVHGVVLKRVMTKAMGRSMNAGAIEIASSVENGAIPASMFEPPTGYQKVSGRDNAGNR